jgi:hypothetical protein
MSANPLELAPVLGLVRDACARESVALLDEFKRRDLAHLETIVRSAVVPILRAIASSRLMPLLGFDKQVNFVSGIV